MMKTVQITIDETLLEQVDKAVLSMGTNRSAFMRQALKIALKQRQLRILEQQQQAGYAQQPLTAAEFDIWQDEQFWGND